MLTPCTPILTSTRRFWNASRGRELPVEASAHSRTHSTWSPISLFLIALMAVGSVIMWIGVPVAGDLPRLAAGRLAPAQQRPGTGAVSSSGCRSG